jgi:hypothetical protein
MNSNPAEWNKVTYCLLIWLAFTVLVSHSALLLCFHSNGTVDMKSMEFSSYASAMAEGFQAHLEKGQSCIDLLLTLGHADSTKDFFHSILPSSGPNLLIALFSIAGSLLSFSLFTSLKNSFQFKFESRWFPIPKTRKIVESTVLLL